jgi:two-component system response regulator ResD
MKKAKIMIADDESRLRTLIKDWLTDAGYEAVEAEDGKVALDKFRNDPEIDLIILDVMMPYLDGWKVCQEIRKTSKVPIIMLTARSEEMDELESFEKGANDYIPKPFSLSVLLARIKARLELDSLSGNIIEHGDLKIDLDQHKVILAGRDVELTPIEYELLVHLAKNYGRVFTRENLLMHVWGYDYYGGDRTVDTHVGRLRIKLGEYGDKYIKTVRGYGYKFEI